MRSQEQEKLQKWMEDYAVHDLLQETGARASCPTFPEPIDFSKESLLAEGQIRLWPACDVEYPPLYGLVMRAGYGRWRVFPFSQLSLPALPQELMIRSAPPAQILQGWNAREIPSAKAAQSWFIESLPDQDCFLVNRWWLCLSAGDQMPHEFEAQVGPQLRHPLDPRHEYLDAEALRSDTCLAEASAVYGERPDIQKAAEPETDYGSDDDK